MTRMPSRMMVPDRTPLNDACVFFRTKLRDLLGFVQQICPADVVELVDTLS